MKRLLSLLVLLAAVSWGTWADETITVSANSEDISQALDLKAVATLFGTAKNVEEFEALLNNPDSAFTNLDLNGDGVVDYLRVVETTADNKHLVVIQAVLAKDVFQDVASIYVEKDDATGEVTTQVIGDEYIYGTNYIIEPVYIYRPYIYDWFWDPYWVCWTSPWYWDYYPYWWRHWHVVPLAHYWNHCYYWHHHHPYCSFRYASHPRPHYDNMRHTVARREFANAHRDRSFTARNAGVSNARRFDATRAVSTRAAQGPSVSRQGGVAPARVGGNAVNPRTATRSDNTFGSSNMRRQPVQNPSRQSVQNPSRQPSSAVSTRQAVAGGQRTATAPQHGERNSHSASVSPRSTQTSATVTRPSATTTRPSATTSRPSATVTRSSETKATTTRSSASTSRPSATTSRSSSYSSTPRSSGSSSSRSSSSASRSSSSSYSGGSRSSSSSSYSGGSHSSSSGFSGGHSSGGFSGGGRSGGGFSGGGGSAPRSGGGGGGGGRR